MVQDISMLAALAKDAGSIQSIHVAASNHL